MYERFCKERLLGTYPLGRAPSLKLVLCLLVVSLVSCVLLFAGKAAEAQELLDDAQGKVQEPAPSEPPPSEPVASEPVAPEPAPSEPVAQQTAPLEQQAEPVHDQAAPVQDQATQPAASAPAASAPPAEQPEPVEQTA